MLLGLDYLFLMGFLPGLRSPARILRRSLRQALSNRGETRFAPVLHGESADDGVGNLVPHRESVDLPRRFE
jgi:hypothetical protein